MNTIQINGVIFTEDDIKQSLSLSNELILMNEELNAKLIAMNAKLENEEKKVAQLKMHLNLLNQAFTGNTYKA